MLRFIKLVVVVVATVLLVLVGGAYLLPEQVKFSRSAEIAAPPDKIFAIIADFRRFNEWSPWAKLDPKTTYTFSGAETGQGAKMEWASNDASVGSGSQTITEAIPPNSMKVAVDFGEMGVSEALWTLEPSGNSTKVTWTFQMKPDGVINRWLGLMMEKFVGPDYEKGLAALKAVAEKEAQGG